MTWLIAVVALLAYQTPLAGDKYKETEQTAELQAQKTDESQLAASIITQATESTSSKNDEQNEAAKGTQQSHDWIDWVNAFSTFVIAGFTVLLFFAVKEQTATSRNIERAWILVTDVGNPVSLYENKPGYVPGIAFKMKVYGHTPAKIVGMNFRCHIVPKDEHDIPAKPLLPEIPIYSAARPVAEIPEDGRLMAPDTLFTISLNLESTTISQQEFIELRDKEKFWCSYGFIDYEDVFGRTSRTQICYIYYIPTGGVIKSPDGTDLNPEGFRVGGPAAYNKAT